MLLVMADGGYLEPPAEDEKPSSVWEETRKRVDRFLPSLLKEVFPKNIAAELQTSEVTDLPESSRVKTAKNVEAKRDPPRETEAVREGERRGEAS